VSRPEDLLREQEREAALALYPPRPNHLEPGRSSAILAVGLNLLMPPATPANLRRVADEWEAER